MHLCLVKVVIFVEAINPIVGEKSDISKLFQVMVLGKFRILIVRQSNQSCSAQKSINCRSLSGSLSNSATMIDVWLNGLPGEKNTKTTKMNRDKTSFSIGKSEKYRKNFLLRITTKIETIKS